MVLRSEQGPYDCEPLGCDGNPALTAARDELAESLYRVPFTPPSINQPEFSHRQSWPTFEPNATSHTLLEGDNG
jgi:hypothetical protein